MAWQRHYYSFASPAQGHYLGLQTWLVGVGRPDTRSALTASNRTALYQQAQVGRKPGSRSRTTKVLTYVIVTPTLGDTLPDAGDVGGENYACMIVIATQLAQVKVQRNIRILTRQCLGYFH